MPYYNVYIDNKPYQLYINDTPCDVCLESGLPKGVWAELDAKYDSSNNTITVEILKLSDTIEKYRKDLCL